MDFLTKLWNYVKVNFLGQSSDSSVKSVQKNTKEPLFNGLNKKNYENEINVINDITDEQIQVNQQRSKYIKTTKNPDYKIKSGDTISKIAEKYGIEERSLMALNGLDKTSATKIRVGQVLKIPPTRTVQNINNLNDVANAMGVSPNFIKKLKQVEDHGELNVNQFHNEPYKDDAGVETIGIGHVLKKGEPRNITNKQVCELCAKDLLKMEDNLCVLLGGKKNYDKLPQAMKEALLDMTFNKGTAIIEDTPGLLYCLKAGKYEAAINKFTNNKSSKTGKEMAGLNKRRLFDISLAIRMYNGKIPQSNLNTAQQVYNRGVELLRAECKREGKNFQAQLAGYNKDVKSYLGNNINLIEK